MISIYNLLMKKFLKILHLNRILIFQMLMLNLDYGSLDSFSGMKPFSKNEFKEEMVRKLRSYLKIIDGLIIVLKTIRDEEDEGEAIIMDEDDFTDTE